MKIYKNIKYDHNGTFFVLNTGKYDHSYVQINISNRYDRMSELQRLWRKHKGNWHFKHSQMVELSIKDLGWKKYVELLSNIGKIGINIDMLK